MDKKDRTTKLRVCVMAKEGEEFDRINAFLGARGVTVVSAKDGPSAAAILRDSEFNGVFLSTPTFLREPKHRREEIEKFQEFFPVALAQWNPAAMELRFIQWGVSGGRAGDTEAFFAECGRTEPRRLRTFERHRINLNVEVESDADGTMSRSFVTDVSSGGCFLHTIEDGRKKGTSVRLRIAEADGLVLDGVVLRRTPWGEPFHLPGVGIRFQNLATEWNEVLVRLVRDYEKSKRLRY